MLKKVLVVDNDIDFLETRCEILAAAGYTTLKATSREEAVRLLEESWVHLAILDMRLRDDDDEKDTSGLTLAKDERYSAVPKIILTRWPTFQAVREALGLSLEGMPAAVDFLDKREGTDAMLAAVGRAFERHVQVSSKLIVESNEGPPATFFHLAALITPGGGSDVLLARAEEIEDLFRRLFLNKDRIRIEHPLWQRKGRVAVKVLAFSEAKILEPLVVTYGERVLIAAEERNFHRYAPHAARIMNTTLADSANTTHFGANSYVIDGPGAEKAVPLAELYGTTTERAFNAVLDNLFEDTLAEWHGGKNVASGGESLSKLYLERLGLSSGRQTRGEIRKRIEFIANQGITLGLILRRDSRTLIFEFGDKELTLPDPTLVLDEPLNLGHSTILMNIPGLLNGDNVLGEEGGHTWFTDFGDAGSAPVHWSFASLEAAIRFDLVRTQNLVWVYEMEVALVGDEFIRFDVNDLEPPLRRPARAVQSIRRHTLKGIKKGVLAYHLGVLYHALARVTNFNVESGLMPLELARLAHVLMASAMTYDHLIKLLAGEGHGAPVERGIYIDKSSRTVLVDGRRVSLPGQAYKILLGLYENSNHVCTRQQIMEQFLSEKYDETDESQIRRLNTAIFRLRERIEDDPHHPRHLLTESGGGYYLAPQETAKR